MAIIKDVFGNYGEAFNLILQKKYAYDILKGIKKIEFRDFFSDKLCAIFFKETKDTKSPEYLMRNSLLEIPSFKVVGNKWDMQPHPRKD